jgi:hypothetical protein
MTQAAAVMADETASANTRDQMREAARFQTIAYYRDVYVGSAPQREDFKNEKPDAFEAAILTREQKIKALNSFGVIAPNSFSLQQKLDMLNMMGNVIHIAPDARFCHWQDSGLVVDLGKDHNPGKVICIARQNPGKLSGIHTKKNDLQFRCATTRQPLIIDIANKKFVATGRTPWWGVRGITSNYAVKGSDANPNRSNAGVFPTGTNRPAWYGRPTPAGTRFSRLGAGE